jgi:hypothetical protein
MIIFRKEPEKFPDEQMSRRMYEEAREMCVKNKGRPVINPLASMTNLCRFVNNALALATNLCRFVNDALALTTNQCRFVYDPVSLNTIRTTIPSFLS